MEVVRKDMIGRDITVGEWVAFPNPRYLGQGMSLGRIKKFSPKGVTISFRRKSWRKDRGYEDETYNCGCAAVLKLDGPELVAHLLQRDRAMVDKEAV